MGYHRSKCTRRFLLQVEQKLISAGLLREDGVELDEDEASGLGGVFNEVEVSDGEEACEILMERLGFDEVSLPDGFSWIVQIVFCSDISCSLSVYPLNFFFVALYFLERAEAF